MIVFNILDERFQSSDDAKTIKKEFICLNKLASYKDAYYGKTIWVPRGFMSVELFGEAESPITVVYAEVPYSKKDSISDIFSKLSDIRDSIGIDFGDSMFIPSSIKIEVLGAKKEAKNTGLNTPAEKMTLFTVHTDGLTPSVAFDAVNAIREEYLGFDETEPLFIPSSVVSVSRI